MTALDDLWDTLAAPLARPDREPDQLGERWVGIHRAQWAYWRTGRTGAVCYWCDSQATGLVSTDAAGPGRISHVGVCGRHVPDFWEAGWWTWLVVEHEPGTVHLGRTVKPH